MAIAAQKTYRIGSKKPRRAARAPGLWPRLAVISGALAALAAAGCTNLPADQEKSAGQAAEMRIAPAPKAGKAGRVTSRQLFMPGGAGGSKAEKSAKARPNYSKIGRASWYGRAFQGKRTASGEIFDAGNLTAAHRTMPLPSYARITNLKNGSSVIVRVNDRGPYAHNRLIDLSQRAAQLLGYNRGGVANVKVDYVGPAPAKTDDKAFLRASYQAGEAPAKTLPHRGEEGAAFTAGKAGKPAAPAVSLKAARQPGPFLPSRPDAGQKPVKDSFIARLRAYRHFAAAGESDRPAATLASTGKAQAGR